MRPIVSADAHQPSEHTRHMAAKGAPVLGQIISRRVIVRVRVIVIVRKRGE